MGQSVAVVLLGLLLGMLLQPSGIGARISHKLPRLSEPLKLSCCCLVGGKQAGAEDFQLLCSQEHPQPLHQ